MGKIRKKLEGSVIDSYSINLNHTKLGITVFAVTLAKLTNAGLDKGQLEVEKEFTNNPHTINIYRIPKQGSTHIITYGFKDLDELDTFFNSTKIRELLHKYIETQEIFTFSHNSLLKNNSSQLMKKAIDELGTQNTKSIFKELELFKSKIKE